MLTKEIKAKISNAMIKAFRANYCANKGAELTDEQISEMWQVFFTASTPVKHKAAWEREGYSGRRVAGEKAPKAKKTRAKKDAPVKAKKTSKKTAAKKTTKKGA